MKPFKLSLFIFVFLMYELTAAPGLKRQGHHYREPSFWDLADKILGIQNLRDVPNNVKVFKGELKALLHELKYYNLEAPAHQTDGWSDFIEAEWPFMAMAYSGFSMCYLPELYPNLKDLCRKEVRWILDAITRPAMSGFVTQHFGRPFPKKGLPNHSSVFVHGHVLYLYLLAKQYLKIDEFDDRIHMMYQAFLRDYSRQALLPSYSSMYYASDNGSALAAMALYDKLFKQTTSQKIRHAAVKSLKNYFLDPDSELIATYINFKKRLRDSGPRGTAVMYLGQFLPDIDPDFSKHQWKQAKKTMLLPLNQVIHSAKVMPKWAEKNSLIALPDSMICMEHPNTMNWFLRQWGDLDSGPVVLGVGTSASGFLVPTAIKNGELKMAHSAMKLAHYMADYKWIGDRYVATNTFHEVGQAIVLYGKVLTFLADKHDGLPERY